MFFLLRQYSNSHLFCKVIMEFSVKINGVYQDFRVKDPAEAAELIRQLTNSPTPTPAATSDNQDALDDGAVFGDFIPAPGTIESALSSLRGSKTAKFIKHLANMENHGGLDSAIKSSFSPNLTISLAPYVASISKACKRAKVPMTKVLIRNEKRIRPGKVMYHYRLTEAAVAYVESVPDYENDEAFGVIPDNSRVQVDPATSERIHSQMEFQDNEPSIRDKVKSMAKGKTIAQMVKESGLTKQQIGAAISAKGETRLYKRRTLPSGAKEYTYIGS